MEDRNLVAKLWGRPLEKIRPPEPTSSLLSIDFWCPNLRGPETEASWMRDRYPVLRKVNSTSNWGLIHFQEWQYHGETVQLHPDDQSHPTSWPAGPHQISPMLSLLHAMLQCLSNYQFTQQTINHCTAGIKAGTPTALLTASCYWLHSAHSNQLR